MTSNQKRVKKSTAKQICKSIKARCPYCDKRLDLTDFAAEFFDRVLLFLKDHDRLVIPAFGRFRMCIHPAQTGVIRMAKGKTKGKNISYSVPARRYLRFSPSPVAKKFLNNIPSDR